MQETDGELLLVLSGKEPDLMSSADGRKIFIQQCKKIQQRLRIATKHPALAAEMRAAGIRVLDRTKHMRALLAVHPKLNEALRVFSPHLWRQQLKSRLQRMGLLTLPKFRILSLVALSVALFYIVVFRLLPSADIFVKPRQESINQTMNMYLAQSGATIEATSHVRMMPLIPIVIQYSHAMKFDNISQQFIGTSARTDLTLTNKTADIFSLRKGTRFSNQAGMIFTITEPANIPEGGELTVHAKAADHDLYGQIIGDRGNVPANLRWDVPGLAPEERVNVFGTNKRPATGGTTAYKSVLQKEDMELAKALFQKELLASAKQQVDEEVKRRNAKDAAVQIRLLDSEKLTKTTFTGVTLPMNLVGKEVKEVPVTGSIVYTAFAYDITAILTLLKGELAAHTRDGRKLLSDRLGIQDVVATPIEWADDFTSIKLTVDLTGTQEYVLDPLTPDGALFAKKVRDQLAGLRRSDALRIIKNMPEVENARITQWPLWNYTLPSIPSHISIIPE